MNWTPALDLILERTIADGGSYSDAARAIKTNTRGRFAPHATTCLRRLRALEGSTASTRVDEEKIPGRVRTPLERKSVPPTMQVVALPLELVEALELEGALAEVFFAETPGWTWELVDAPGDALACAQHRASLRGDELVLLERHRNHVVVAVRFRGEEAARTLVLAVVRHVRQE